MAEKGGESGRGHEKLKGFWDADKIGTYRQEMPRQLPRKGE